MTGVVVVQVDDCQQQSIELRLFDLFVQTAFVDQQSLEA